ncbi:ATP-binding SpoIIE family protein phosphatase [Streptomyces aidingensis]|uniref:protein-serine/threonine phosphatase n=1 Tax=Streptomyces aidingensis TaxID=910347 RepID=A0A1I1K0T8_9ACTN|nr:SpoIIE family protein phosphatase [Streptomyces aidingensis]SFC54225.1 Histidine kinase-like ATPase domain-containing protein [Streptomyces aidingensis]
MRTEDVLAASETGLWRWDQATGTATMDAIAARLMGLPPRFVTVGESEIRARVHVEDFIELQRLGTLALAERRVVEGRMRILDADGRVLRRLRTRIRVVGEGVNIVMAGVLMQVVEGMPEEEAAEAASGHPELSRPAGDWRLSREAFLLDAGRALAEARTTGEVLRVVSSLALPGFTPDGMCVFGIKGDELSLIGRHGYPLEGCTERREVPGHRGPAPDPGLDLDLDLGLDSDYPAAEAIRSGRAVYLPSPAEYRRRYPAAWPFVRAFGRSAWAYLPLTAGGRTIGAWMVAFPEPVAFTPDERSVLTTVARMLAQSLARTHVFESERALATDLQQTMAPTTTPQVPGLLLAGRYVPTGGGLQIGGDWYDVIPLPSQRAALVIGDVQGHGVRAAAVMAQLRIALRAYAAEGHRPDAVLARASRFLAGVEDEDGGTRFATCLYVEVDTRTGSLEVARAGHPDVGVRLADGTSVLRPTEGGPPLGIDPDWAYPTTRLVLQPDETLVMCTDGLLETGGHDLETGWARLRRVLEAHPGDDLEKLADALIDAVYGPPSHRSVGPHTDRREDDIALLMLRRPEHGRVPRRAVLSVAQAEPARIAEARHQLAELLHDWGSQEQLDGAVLMLSELLTNVLVHTDSDAVLVTELTGQPGERLLRVAVTDTSDVMPHRREPGELASSGRGLLLMEVLADAWGVDPRGDGKTTWFELRERPERLDD